MEKSVKKKQSGKISFSQENIKNFLNKNLKTVLMGMVLLANYFMFINHYTDASKRSQEILLLSYENVGFGARTLLGSVLSLLGFSSEEIAPGIFPTDIFLFIVYFAVCALFFALIIKIPNGNNGLNKSKNKMKNPELFIMLLCACPFYLYAFSYEFFGNVNCFLLLLLLVCLLLMKNKKLLPLVPLICAFAIFVDHTFAVTYLPAVCCLLWYKSKKSNGKPYGRAYGITVLTSIPLFVLMIPLAIKNNFSNVTYGNGHDIFYAREFKIFQDILQIHETVKAIGFNEFIRFFFVLPLIIFLAFLWIRSIKLSEKKDKILFKFCFAQLFVLLVPLIYFKGFGSWIAAVLSSQIALVISFASEKNSAVSIVINKLNLYLEKRTLWLFAFAALFYISVTDVLPLLFLPVW